MTPTGLVLPPLEQVEAELAELEQEIRRRRWREDPAAWAAERLGDHLWTGQVRILRSVKAHRKTAVATCHGVGKSFSAAEVASWWLDIHKPGEAFVITTAPTQPQVRIILWKEIGRAHQRGNLLGRVNQTEWKVRIGQREETIAIGRKPSDYSPASFQGVHAPYVLVIVDEANGVRGNLWEAFDAVTVNEDSRLLAIGNPDDPTGEFFEACKPGSGWHVIHISAFDSPNFTGEELPPDVLKQLISHTYVEEKRRKWAPSWTWVGSRCVPPEGSSLEDTHPFWQSKILGQFPVQTAAGSLIPLSWIRAAQERTLRPVGVNELGLDVGASEDGDPTCLGHRRGPVFRVLYEERQPDTMKSTGRLIQHLQMPNLGATRAKVDYIGVGRGVVDRSREQGLPVHPIQVGEKSTVLSCLRCKHEWDELLAGTDVCPQCGSQDYMRVYANLLSQLWWMVRGLFEVGEIDIDPTDEDLAEQLLSLRWEPNSKGQIVVKYGDGPSPNRADALMFSFSPLIEREVEGGVLAGAATW